MDEWAAGRTLLRSADPVLRGLVDADPLLHPADVFDGWGCDLWTAVLRQVIDQHISHRSASAIVRKLRDHYAGRLPTAREFLSATRETYSAVGLSSAKVGTLRDVATRIARGELGDAATEAVAFEKLVGIKGIGRFTVDGVLILAWRSRDVMPAADLVLRKAVARQWRLPELPSVRAVDERALAWRPWRTLAAAHLYRTMCV